MTSQIFERREELKGFLEGENYLTFLDLLLNYSGKVIQKLIRRKQMVSFYWSAAFICIVILGIGLGISALSGEKIEWQFIKTEVLGIALAFLSLIIFKIARNTVVEKISNKILGSIQDENNIVDLQKWLYQFSNVKAHLIFCIIYAISFTYGLRQEFTGYGSSFIVFFIAFIWGIPMYFLILFILLPYKLGRYELHLYKADPSSSKIIYELSHLFGGLIYLYAIVAAGSMIFIAYSGLLPSLALPSILVAWLPIIIFFSINQYALSSIISRGKWNTLREIQIQVENIQAKEDLTDKNNMDKVIRLMDYHDRVKATRNSALDIKAGLDFLNSLLLPVIGFFIGNIDINVIKDILEKTKSWFPLHN